MRVSHKEENEAAARQARRSHRVARYEQVRELHAIGLPITQIAQRLGISWTTARNVAYAEVFPERAATKLRQASSISMPPTWHSVGWTHAPLLTISGLRSWHKAIQGRAAKLNYVYSINGSSRCRRQW